MVTGNAWIGWALLSAIFAALTALFAKLGVDKLDSDYATLLRTLVILGFLVVVVGLRGVWRNPTHLSRMTVWALTLSGVAAGLSWLCYFRAMKSGTASTVAPIDKLSVVFVALLSVAFLGESLQMMQWLGIALIALGSLLVALYQK